MKWFKHDTDARRSEGVKRLDEEFGPLLGYARWMYLLEIITEKMDKTDRCYVEYPAEEWRILLKVKQKKLERFLELTENFMETKVVTSGNFIKISVPNLLKKRDDASRKSGLKDKKVTPRSKMVDKEDKDIKESKQKKKSPPSKKLEIKILDYLNRQAAKSFKPTEANLKFITGRLGDGFTYEQFVKVINGRVKEWKFHGKMNEYLRPKTLFCPSNFDGYLNANGAEAQSGPTRNELEI